MLDTQLQLVYNLNNAHYLHNHLTLEAKKLFQQEAADLEM
jgi:hypothetical protein